MLKILLFTCVLLLVVIFQSGAMENKNSGSEKKSPKTVRVAGAKLTVSADIHKNLQSIKYAIDFASREKADILLTPEGSLSGYTPEFDQNKVENALTEVVNYATNAGIGLALGTCFVESTDGKCYNQIRFYDKQGHFLGFHSKILRCGSYGESGWGEINQYAVTPLRTFEFEGLKIGGLICNDMWANPCCTTLPDNHLSQQLSEMEAKIIFHAVNGGRDDSRWAEINWNFHETNLLMRASAGSIWIVTADNSAPINLKSSAPSGVVNPKGEWVCKTKDKGEHLFVYTIELE